MTTSARRIRTSAPGELLHCARGPVRSVATRPTRDGHTVTSGPIVERSPDMVHGARLRLAALFAIGLAVALWVHALVGGGFAVSVPVQSVEEDDAPRGDR